MDDEDYEAAALDQQQQDERAQIENDEHLTQGTSWPSQA